MSKNWKVERLQKGESFITSERGNSMTPLIKDKQKFRLQTVIFLKNLNEGDIVYCKVKGRFYTHLVKAIDDKRGVLIGNNHGRINGWTKQVYGKVIEIL